MGGQQQWQESHRYERYEEKQQSRNEKSDEQIRKKSAYEILGVSVSTSPEEIVSAYRQMAKMYHPDRLAHLAPEFVALAEERMKEINAAYEELKQIPRSPRRNGLPVKLIDGSLLMRYEHLAGAPVELLEGAKTASRSNRVLHHPPEAFDRVEVVPTMGG